ncbi:MAG: RNA-binding transcriptional accessory protein, partial [Clostridia bacterium]|nr:RNA-binding transcriptional accessory protein [Clostridia bacterium]
MEIIQTLIEEFSLKSEHANNIVNLIDEGNTIPFIARYRKELTGSFDDQVLRSISDRLTYLRNLQKRKEEVTASITEQGKMTEEIAAALAAAKTLTEVEDIYRPYKQKKQTRASKAIERGLQPLADIILEQDPKTDPALEAQKYVDEEKGVKSVTEALNGAKDIIAEIASDNAEIRKKLRNIFSRNGIISSSYTKKQDEDEQKTYEMYAEYAEPVTEAKSHRILALNRGESEGFLKVNVNINADLAKRIVCVGFVKNDSPCGVLVKEACEDAYTRLIEPSVQREVRATLTDDANEQAIQIFEKNLRPLLMQPPVKNKVTLGWDPGYRTGCKICVVDGTGKVLAKTVVYPTLYLNGKNEDKDSVSLRRRYDEAKIIIRDLLNKYQVELIAVGNGTASKESEIFVADLLKEYPRPVDYMMVSEAGASVYSASKLGAEEFPEYDVSERSAVSIARRLQDPLAELIKIDPKSIGVGQYQHAMDQKRLDSVLQGVVEDCVNSVGVDLNTASAPLLKYVAGLNAGIAKNIVAYREAHGKFTNRKQILKVPKLGEKAFTQCAGFLRIDGGDCILDNTAVHPESYEKAEKLLALFGYSDEDVKARNITDLAEKVKAYGDKKASEDTGLDNATMKDIVEELKKPGRDIRDALPKPV